MRQGKRPKNIRHSLTVSHLLVGFLPVAFIAVFIVWFMFRTVEKDHQEKIEMLSRAVSGQIQVYFGQPLSIMHTLGHLLEAVTDQDAAHRIVASHLHDTTYFEAFYLLDRQGKVREAILPTARQAYQEELQGISVGHKQEFRKAVETGQAQWSDTFLSLTTGNISLSLYVPYNGGVLAADIDLQLLSGLIGNLSNANITTSVIDRNGAIIFHPDEKLVGSNVMMNSIPLVAQALAGSEGSGRFTFRRQEYTGVTRQIAATGWICLFAEPVSNLIARLKIFFLILVVGVVAAAGLALSLAYYRARRLARPISAISRQAAGIAQGDYQLPRHQSSIEELTQLSRNIEEMGGAIRQREVALLENQQKYRELVESTSNLVMQLDSKYQIRYANHTFSRLVGVASEVSVGHSLAEFLVPDDWQRFASLIWTLASEHRGSASFEAGFRHSEGTVRTLLLTVNLHFDSQGELSDLGLVGHDITARLRFEEQQKELDHQRQQAQKMELLGLMAGGVAHDLNNILSGIVSYPELLLLQLEKDSPHREKIMAIKQSGERAAAVVADLLTVARGTATVRKVVSLDELLKRYCQSPEFNELRQHHPLVGFELKLAPSLCACSCSPIHVEKAVMNLVVNAFEAVQGRGQVQLICDNITRQQSHKLVPELAPGPYVRVRVVDSGKGIETELLDRIFEPFFTRKSLGRSGTGLGLTVAWSSIREHDGTIKVVSNRSGTEMSVFLPALEGESDIPQEGEAENSLQGNGETILVVDDEEHLRKIAKEMLELLGYTVAVVPSGEESLRYLADSPVDLVLLDMIMDQGMNGRQTYEKIRQLWPRQKAIVVSGFSASSDVEETLALGAGGFVQKPYALHELARAVQQVLAD